MCLKLAGMKTLGLSCLALAGWITSARGAVIDFSEFGWQATVPEGVDLTALSTTNNGVTLALEKTADFINGAGPGGVISPLSITFQQVSANAVPNLAIDDEVVINDTGSPWIGFVFGLSGGVANGGILPHISGQSAGFSVDPFTNSSFTPDGRGLIATGGIVPSSVFPQNLFKPGNASGELVIAAEPFASIDTPQTFNFTEQPLLQVVPEPSVVGMVVMCLSVGGDGSPQPLSHARVS